jgi:hypothetical protein
LGSTVSNTEGSYTTGGGSMNEEEVLFTFDKALLNLKAKAFH